MQIDSDHFPQVQALYWKHHFGRNDNGSERYVTLQVSGARGRQWTASLFGSEHRQINQQCKDMSDGCMLIESRFRTSFPDHVCSDGCFTSWQSHDAIQGSDSEKIQ
jgi:hypothetical protein